MALVLAIDVEEAEVSAQLIVQLIARPDLHLYAALGVEDLAAVFVGEELAAVPVEVAGVVTVGGVVGLEVGADRGEEGQRLDGNVNQPGAEGEGARGGASEETVCRHLKFCASVNGGDTGDALVGIEVVTPGQ